MRLYYKEKVKGKRQCVSVFLYYNWHDSFSPDGNENLATTNCSIPRAKLDSWLRNWHKAVSAIPCLRPQTLRLKLGRKTRLEPGKRKLMVVYTSLKKIKRSQLVTPPSPITVILYILSFPFLSFELVDRKGKYVPSELKCSWVFVIIIWAEVQLQDHRLEGVPREFY